MGDNNPTDYFWHSKTNQTFIGRCHIETGNTWFRFGFDSDIGHIERPQDIHGNPIFIVLDGGKTVSVRGAVTIAAQDTEQMGTVTFTPQEEGITEWHWTLIRDGQTHVEEGRGMFRQDEPKPAARSRARKRPTSKRTPVSRKKPASVKVARKKKPAAKKKPAGKKKTASKKKPASKKKQPRRSRRTKR
jgi:histone H1/5